MSQEPGASRRATSTSGSSGKNAQPCHRKSGRRRGERQQRVLRTPDPQLPLRVPARHWELDEHGPADPARSSRRAAAPSSSRRSPSRRSARSRRRSRTLVFDEGKGLSTEEQQYDPTPIINERPPAGRPVAGAAESQPVAGDAGNGAPAPALAAPPVQRHPPLLLPGRGRRDRHLADRGRAQRRQGRQAVPRPSGQRQQRRQPGADAPGAEAGHRRRQDHRHGDAHRLADRSMPSAARSSKTFTRGFLVVTPGLTINDRLRVLQPNDPDSYYQSRELVPERHARRPGAGQDRHHQLPRLQAARAHASSPRAAASLLQGRGERARTRSKPKARCSSGSCPT